MPVPLADESPNVADGHLELLGELIDADESRWV
jgi:hypothetical protein